MCVLLIYLKVFLYISNWDRALIYSQSCLYSKFKVAYQLLSKLAKFLSFFRISLCQYILKACVHSFYQIFIFSPSDSPSETIKNDFYFIEKAFLKFFPLLSIVSRF